MNRRLISIYKKLYAFFGPQQWWPGDSPFEVIVGAILTQNTNWKNVQKAIFNLKKNKLLSTQKLSPLPVVKLARLIRPSGYYNVKARRLREFLKFFLHRYAGSVATMARQDREKLRAQLVAIKGIGPETADSILLYALSKPVFVIDAYTKRIFSRHGLLKENATYQEAQDLFMQNLRKDAGLFNEYHALLVKLGKEFCRKNNPRCNLCPLK